MSKIRMERKCLSAKIPAIGIRRCVIRMTRGKHLNFGHTRQSNNLTKSRKRNNPGILWQVTIYHSESVDGQNGGNVSKHHRFIVPFSELLRKSTGLPVSVQCC